MRLEPKASGRSEFRDPPEVIGSGDNRDVPHIHRELGQIGSDVGTLPVPAQQRPNGEAVSLIPISELSP
jgi:hypothetical protein